MGKNKIKTFLIKSLAIYPNELSDKTIAKNPKAYDKNFLEASDTAKAASIGAGVVFLFSS